MSGLERCHHSLIPRPSVLFVRMYVWERDYTSLYTFRRQLCVCVDEEINDPFLKWKDGCKQRHGDPYPMSLVGGLAGDGVCYTAHTYKQHATCTQLLTAKG